MSDSLGRLAAALAGRYTIERELGQGGMATVYLAEDVKHHRKVAVKVLRPELAAILGGERFLNEIQVTANLQHPNILPLYDSGEADSFLYYVMPLVEGESLREKMNRERQLGVQETVEIAKGVSGALQFAHERGVVHRDIKPENILLQSGQPLVADFGIALAVSQAGGTRLTETGLSLGTPHYMSPEQATGDRDIDARSDVYSLGVVVYEMLAGEPPYLGNSVQAVIAKILSERPIPLGQSRDLLPPNVDAAVQQALAKSPADRFSRAADFAAALQNPGFTIATSPAVTSTPERSTPWNRLAVGLAAALTIVTVVALFGWLRPDSGEVPQVLRYVMALPDARPLGFVRGNRVALSSDGSRLAMIAEIGAGVRIVHRRRDAVDEELISGTESAQHVFFSPDGSRLGFIMAENRNGLRVVSQGGGPATVVADSSVGLDGATWSDDGFIYFDGLTSGTTMGIERIAPTGELREQVTTVDTAAGETDHIWPEALPDGRGILFQVVYRSTRELVTAVKGSDEAAHRLLVEAVQARYLPSGYLVYVTSSGLLMAVRFDLARLETVGEAVALDESVGIRPFGSVDLTTSRTGTLMYVAGAGANAPDQVMWVDREGNAEPVDPEWKGNFRTLAISPDGQRLAVSQVDGGEQHLWIKQLPDGPLSKLTFEGTYNSRPRWTPDGRSVLFQTNRGATEAVWIKRADGSAVAELLLQHPGRPILEAGLVDGGRWIVYTTVPRDILGQRVGDSVSVELVAGAFEQMSPAVSPDGRWIAYQSNESSRSEIYVRPFPNTSEARWQVSTGRGGFSPLWSPDGSELFHTDLDQQWIAVEVLPGTSFVTGPPRVLFNMQPYYAGAHTIDITPDGRRFVMIRGGEFSDGTAGVGDVVVVENVDEALRRRFGD